VRRLFNWKVTIFVFNSGSGFLYIVGFFFANCPVMKYRYIEIGSIIHELSTWGSANNPLGTTEKFFQHKHSVNVWCCLTEDLLIGTFVSGQRLIADNYLHMKEFLLSINDVSLKIRLRMSFQNDRELRLFYRQFMDYFNQRFGNRRIGSADSRPWLSRSLYITLLNFFFGVF
jgi:hypothetical protein